MRLYSPKWERSIRPLAETKELFDGKNDRESWLQLAQIYEKAKNWTEMGKALAEAEKLSNIERRQGEYLVHARRDV